MDTVMVQHKRSTQRSERSVITVHLRPAFGDYPLSEITAEALQCWVSSSRSAPKTIKNVVITLKSLWVTARAWGRVQHDPFLGLRMPAVRRGNTYTFSVEQTLAILDRAQGWHKLFIRVLAETGMRTGELAGLRRCDVLTRSVRITQSVWQREVQTPKTETAVRTFAISTSLAGEIQRHIAASLPNPHGLVFAADNGRPLSTDHFRHRVLSPILEALGIRPDKRCGLYAFRHMNATLMDNLGTPLETRRSRLGHAQIETTLIHYTHGVDAEDLAAADQIGALLQVEGGRPQ